MLIAAPNASISRALFARRLDVIVRRLTGYRKMKTVDRFIVLEDAKSFSPTASGVDYTDESGARIHVPMSLLVRLYEGAKHDLTRKGVDWKKFCDSLFST
jgi:hypothetical protein